MTYRGNPEDVLRSEFRGFVERGGCDVGMLWRAVLERAAHRGSWILRCEFNRGAPYFIDLPPFLERYLHAASSGRHDVTSLCLPLFSLGYEDAMVEREQRELERAYHEGVQWGANPAELEALQRTINERAENIRRHHRAIPPPRPIREIAWRGPLFVSEELAREFIRDNPLLDYLSGGFGGLSTESEQRGIALLKSWLSPSQLAQYEKDRCFDVIGGETGKRYRINHGRQMNIDELDADGNKVCRWCFLPEGGLVAGDCMGAQKIALETNESVALKTANRFGVESAGGGLFASIFTYDVETARREWARPDGYIEVSQSRPRAELVAEAIANLGAV